MGIVEQAVEQNRETWEGYLEHPFVRALGEGTLDRRKFRKYILEDTAYLKEYAKCWAMAVTKADTFAAMRKFCEVLNVVLNVEAMTRTGYAKELGITEKEAEEALPSPENAAYTGYMLRVGETGSLLTLLGAVLPCMLSYCYIGRKLKARCGETYASNPYREWIEDYANDGYLENCKGWTAYANALGEQASKAEREAFFKAFQTSSAHERNFWEMSERG